jgi:radical SAM protein with 4Fe4S-binding SPASM domain
MCNIWQQPSENELNPDEYLKLPSSLKVVNVTGGEPFIRSDIDLIVKNLVKLNPKMRVVISSNGFFIDAMKTKLIKIKQFLPSIGVGVSLQGIEEVHNSVRGNKESFKRAVASLKMLKDIGIKDIRTGMTFTEENCGQIKDVYALSRELGIQFTGTYAHNSDVYFKTSSNVKKSIDLTQLDDVIKSELKSRKAKSWFRAYYFHGAKESLSGKKKIDKCCAGERFFYMDPFGNVYPCIMLDQVMGNIRDFKDFDELFNGPQADKVRQRVKECPHICWMVCTVRSNLIRHPLEPISWSVKNKLVSIGK